MHIHNEQTFSIVLPCFSYADLIIGVFYCSRAFHFQMDDKKKNLEHEESPRAMIVTRRTHGKIEMCYRIHGSSTGDAEIIEREQ